MKAFLAALALGALASTSQGRVIYTRTTAPPGWAKGARADAAAPFAFRVALNVQELERLEAKFVLLGWHQHPGHPSLQSP